MSTLDADAWLAQLAAAPDDAAAYLVYADALLRRGDPRGELIAVHVALETARGREALQLHRRADELYAAHADAWLPLAAQDRRLLVVRWARGFIHAARVLFDSRDASAGPDEDIEVPDSDDDDGERATGAIRALLDAPGVRHTLAELHLGPRALTWGGWTPTQPIVHMLGAAWPPALRRLYLNVGDVRAVWATEALDLAPLACATQLEELVVQGAVTRLGWDAPPPALRRFELRAPDGDLALLAGVDVWPHLETLSVWGNDPGALAVLTPARFPRLRALGLVGTRGTDALVRALAALPIARQLAQLDLSGGTLSPHGTRALVALPGLAHADVRRNLLPKSDAAAAASRGWLASAQRRGKAPWLDRSELEKIATRMADVARGDDETRPGPRVALARLRAVLDVAGAGDARWAHPWHALLVERLAPAEAQPARLALLARWQDELAPELRARGAELHKRIASAYEELGALDDAERAYRHAAALAAWSGDAAAEIEAIAGIASLCVRRGAPDLAAPLFARVTAHYQATRGRHHVAWSTRQQGNVELVRSEFARAEAYYLEALRLYRELQSPRDEAIVMSELAGVLWSRQDFAGAETMLRDSIARSDPDSLAQASSYANLAAILNNNPARNLEGRAAANEALARFRKHRHRHGEAQALNILGELAQRRNEHGEAVRMIEAAIAIQRELGVQRDLGVALGNLSRVALDLGDLPRARACCEEAVELHRDSGNKYNEGLQLLGLCDAALAAGDAVEAAAFADEAMVPLAAIAALPAIAAVRMRQGQLAQRAGALADAEAHYRLGMADAERGNHRELSGWNELWLATALAAQGRADQAEEALASARGKIASTSAHGVEAVLACEAVVARLGGADVVLPAPRAFGARMFVVLAGG